MLRELASKGGIDNVIDQYQFQVVLQSEQAEGKRILNGTEPNKIDKLSSDARLQTQRDINDYQSNDGYQPQKLITRGLHKLDSAVARSHNQSVYQVKKNKKYFVIDKRLDAATSEYFQKVVRPRQTLLDSEGMALDLLKSSYGIGGKQQLMQLPLDKDQSDQIYDTLKTQIVQSNILNNDVQLDNSAPESAMQQQQQAMQQMQAYMAAVIQQNPQVYAPNFNQQLHNINNI